MTMTTEEAKAILAFCGMIIAVGSLLVATRSLLLNLERSRRELAVRLIYDWANHLDWATSRAIRIATELPSDVVSSIGKRKPTKVPSKFYDGISSILRIEFPAIKLSDERPDINSDFELTEEQSSFIRYLWIRWLNRLEGTLAAWARGAADLSLMHWEFEPLVKGSEPALEALKEIRVGLPVIDKFYSQILKDGEIDIVEPLGMFTQSWSWKVSGHRKRARG